MLMTAIGRHGRLFLAAVLVAGLSACAAAPRRSACQSDMELYPNRVACHDEAFHALGSQPETALPILRDLCDRYGLARACANVAFVFEQPSAAAPVPDPAAAREYYRKGCERDDGVACNNLANLLFLGRGGPVAEREGVEQLQRGCGLGYAASCYRLGVLTGRGTVIPADPAAAAAYLKKGCDLGDAASCHDLGYRYLDGTGVARDGRTGMELIRRACDRGLARGCGTLGSLYLQGGSDGVDYAKAAELLQTACAGDDAPSCSNLGYLVETGKGIIADPARAAQFYAKACTGGDPLGCGNLGVLLADGRGRTRDDRAALPLLERGCSDAGPEACRYLATFHAEGRADLPRSPATARYYQTRACEYGDEPTCAALTEGMATLCRPGEQAVFACQTGQARQLSLCRREERGGAASLVYRFGTLTAPELTLTGPFQLLMDNWTNGESAALEFGAGATRYTLTESRDISQDPPRRQAELTVTQNGATTRIPCRYPLRGSVNNDAVRKAANITPAPAGGTP